MSHRAPVTAVLSVAAVLMLTGCAGTVALQPAPHATDPGCAEVIVRLPDKVADLPQRETDAQATSAWGNPAAILLHCGVPEYGPTTLPCDEVNGIDWIRDDSDAPNYRFTTYGRSPATEIIIDSNAASGTSALVDIAQAVSAVPQKEQCTDIAEVR